MAATNYFYKRSDGLYRVGDTILAAGNHYLNIDAKTGGISVYDKGLQFPDRVPLLSGVLPTGVLQENDTAYGSLSLMLAAVVGFFTPSTNNTSSLASVGQKIGDVAGGNYTEIEADGTLKFVGNATVWEDINLPISACYSAGATALDAVVIGSNNFKAFNGTATAQQVESNIEILHSYKGGSDIVPHMHFLPDTSAAGNIKFSFGYRWFNGGAVMAAETVVPITVNGPFVANTETRVDFATLSGVGKTIGSRLVWRILRNPSDVADTYTGKAIAIDFGVHYERDTVGSRTIATK